MSKERKAMNIELNLEEMANQVKELMTRLNYAIDDKGLPTIATVGKEIFGETNLYAAYAPTEHCIFINSEKPVDDEDVLEIIAHELTHAYQDLSFATSQKDICIDPTNDLYWEQKHERQAFTIGGTWMTLNSPDDYIGQDTKIKMEWTLANNPKSLEDQWISSYRKIFQEMP